MKIKLDNGDFITLDEKVYPQKAGKYPVKPEEEETDLTIAQKIAISLAAVVLNFYLRESFKRR